MKRNASLFMLGLVVRLSSYTLVLVYLFNKLHTSTRAHEQRIGKRGLFSPGGSIYGRDAQAGDSAPRLQVAQSHSRTLDSRLAAL
eukprot:4131418-Pyramimonas_sp.AAC.1